MTNVELNVWIFGALANALWPVHLASSQNCDWNRRVKQIKKPSGNDSRLL